MLLDRAWSLKYDSYLQYIVSLGNIWNGKNVILKVNGITIQRPQTCYGKEHMQLDVLGIIMDSVESRKPWSQTLIAYWMVSQFSVQFQPPFYHNASEWKHLSCPSKCRNGSWRGPSSNNVNKTYLSSLKGSWSQEWSCFDYHQTEWAERERERKRE